MFGVSCADMFSMICSGLSLFVTILVGGWQIMQNHRMNKLERRQIDVEKKRYEESVEIEARQFLVKYFGCIGLLPLCAIAFVYDKNRAYSREMYSEFRLLSRDVRLKIFERCGWAMCDVQTGDFFEDCLKCLQKAVEQFLPKDDFESIFYENGKYVKRAISRYASCPIPHAEFEYEDRMTDILVIPFRKDALEDYDSSVIEKIKCKFDFGNCDEIEACQVGCLIARYVSIYAGQRLNNDSDVKYGSPGSWSSEELETMEDLFLVILFEIWSHLWLLKEGREVNSCV